MSEAIGNTIPPAGDTPDGQSDAVPAVKKKDLLDRVLERCDVKKRDAKPAIEAALAVLAEAIDAEEELVLPPLGRLKVTRRTQKENAEVLIVRLRRSHAMTSHQVKSTEAPQDSDQ